MGEEGKKQNNIEAIKENLGLFSCQPIYSVLKETLPAVANKRKMFDWFLSYI